VSTGSAPAPSQAHATKRRVPRYKLAVPLDITVVRSGVPENISGRTLEMGEGGLGVIAASRLLVGESVRVEFLVPHTTMPVRATAVVRYERERCFGLEFLRLPSEPQSMIRYWTRGEAELRLAPKAGAKIAQTEPQLEPNSFEIPQNANPGSRIWTLVAFMVGIGVAAAVLGWWHWQQGWSQLEAKAPAKQSVGAPPQMVVPADVMERQIVQKILPEYPEPARQARVQGTVVLDTIVNGEGAVTQMKVVSGPEALSHAAMDAVRWWRYAPYVVNGQPVAVETTVAVNFRLEN
jgi:TonB family protein